MKNSIRKGMGYLLAFGATLSIGLLAFAGMFALSPIPWLCGGAFIMAGVYEGHINHENIAQALVRLFDTQYLQLALIRQRIRRQLKNTKLNEILFLKNYRKLDQEIKKLKHLLEHDIKNKKIKKEKEEALKTAETQLRKMEEDYYARIRTFTATTATKSDTDTLCVDVDEPQQAFLKQLNNRKKLIRVGAFFAIGGGIAAALATLSAMQLGFAMFAVTSAIPGGILVTLAIFAGIGYSLLLYRSIAEMIEQYSDKAKSYFSKKENESNASHIARSVLTVIGIGLAIFATIATAGTWWYAAKHGATLLRAGERIAAIVRTVTVSLMALPTLIYAARNSVDSAEKVSRINVIKWFDTHLSNVSKTWSKENVVQFLNPFRLIEKLVSGTAKTILFLVHVVCDGLMSDRPGFIGPAVSTALSSASAGFVEAPQVGGEEHGNEEEGGHNHSHDSFVLRAIYFPVKVASFILRGCASIWDFITSGGKSAKASKEKFFPEEHEHSHDEISGSPHAHGHDHKHSPHTKNSSPHHHHCHEHHHEHEHKHSPNAKKSHDHDHDHHQATQPKPILKRAMSDSHLQSHSLFNNTKARSHSTPTSPSLQVRKTLGRGNPAFNAS